MEMLQKSNSAHEFSKFETVQKNLELSMNIIIESKIFNYYISFYIVVFFCLDYYSGFNSAVSVFGGIVEKINGIRDFIININNIYL